MARRVTTPDTFAPLVGLGALVVFLAAIEGLQRAWADEIATLAPMSLAYSKKVLNNPDLGTDDPALVGDFEACFSSADVAEGRKARSEKRAPVFTGR